MTHVQPVRPTPVYGGTLRLTGAGSAMSLHSSAPALLQALRTRCPGDTAPYLNQARATYPGGVSELDAALLLLHPPDQDLEVGKITVFVEGADEAPTRPCPTNSVYDGARPTPPYAVMCEAFPRGPTCRPALPPATHASRGWGSPNLSPPLSRTRGAHHRGQVLWQERPGTPLRLLVVTTSGDPERILGVTPTHPYGAAPVPRPPLPVPAARDGVYTFLRTQEVTAVTGVDLVRLPTAPADDPREPRALSPVTNWELWRDVWTAWLTHHPPQCRWMATGPRPHEANATAGLPSPPPLPPAEHWHSTAHGTPQMHQAVEKRARLPPRMPTRITVMSDSNGSPQRDDRHHRRSRSRSPVSPGCAGETLAEGEERRLAEPAAPIGPPARQPRAAPADAEPSIQGPAPAEETAPAAKAASPAAPPPECAPGAQGAETAAPACRATALTAAPRTTPAQGSAPARAPSTSAGAFAAAAERKEGAKYRAPTNPSHTLTSPPKPYPPHAAFPKRRPRPIRPPTPVRTTPGVTLPQLR